ncbi:hypothetical protein CISIN_1g039150mg [Citrus sinensis]|uniref:FBD domain-containing protein n=1 Tax=Citrus sinensis TaxID=2711 RepID=A0A067EC99_CITSI|nr:hypothetical protein CISIN_1g039150mg [Citrus sinensis]
MVLFEVDHLSHRVQINCPDETRDYCWVAEVSYVAVELRLPGYKEDSRESLWMSSRVKLVDIEAEVWAELQEVLNEVQFVSDEWGRLWREPKAAPMCMCNYLEVIGIKGYQGKQYELTVVKFLLREALVPEKMVISALPLTSDEEMMLRKTMLEYRRGSKDCRIIFSSDS